MKTNKALFIASVASMIDQFNMENISILLDMGCEVHVAANFSIGNTTTNARVEWLKKSLEKMGVIVYNIPFSRGIGGFVKNYKVYKIIFKIISDNKYKMIHLHSPIGGAIGRLAARKARKRGTNILYTAHGFHFFKGAPIFNWIIFYPIEYLLSIITDTIITINREDYNIAKKFKASNVVHIPGVGVDVSKFSVSSVNVLKKKEELGIPVDYFIILSVGELSKRKNHQIIVKAIQRIKNKKIAYIICGKGKEKENILKISRKLDENKCVKLLGYRADINEIMAISNCFAFPSKREGLGIAAIEAMACGLPLLTSNINGINDYSIDCVTGYSYSPYDIDGFSNGITRLIENENLRNMFAENNKEKAKLFDISKTNKIMHELYKNILEK